MILHDYYRSSAAYRVRIALNLKRLQHEKVPVNLAEGEQQSSAYRALNPQSLVPALETESGVLTQSLAIIEYLEDRYPERPLLSADDWQRARQRSMCQLIACDIHPLNNLRVLNFLRGPFGHSEDDVQQWIAHWIVAGFEALEQQAAETPYLGGDQPMLPDVVLVPQVFNARRYEVPLDHFPRLVAIADRCNALDEFAQAAPGSTA